MRKLIDIPEEIVKPLEHLTVESDSADLKNYIQDLLIKHVAKTTKQSQGTAANISK